MKLYKFRPLGTRIDFERAKVILETGHFWCASFSELNDPMEGAFHAASVAAVDAIYDQKKRFKICSFSAREAFKNPVMWGYYANGFKGIAIEIDVDESVVMPIEYVPSIMSSYGYQGQDETKTILTTKLSAWKHEKEFRYLKDSPKNLHRVGRIEAVYFGRPYSRAVNRGEIYKQSESLKLYDEFAAELVDLARNVKSFHVDVQGEGVEVLDKCDENQSRDV